MIQWILWFACLLDTGFIRLIDFPLNDAITFWSIPLLFLFQRVNQLTLLSPKKLNLILSLPFFPHPTTIPISLSSLTFFIPHKQSHNSLLTTPLFSLACRMTHWMQLYHTASFISGVRNRNFIFFGYTSLSHPFPTLSTLMKKPFEFTTTSVICVGKITDLIDVIGLSIITSRFLDVRTNYSSFPFSFSTWRVRSWDWCTCTTVLAYRQRSPSPNTRSMAIPNPIPRMTHLLVLYAPEHGKSHQYCIESLLIRSPKDCHGSQEEVHTEERTAESEMEE